MSKRLVTTKQINLLQQLYSDGQLRLAPEFQRNSVWPAPAKAYLIDTILSDRPMPLFFFQRVRSAQTGRPVYHVVDGQQRLRAIFDYLDDRFKLTKSPDSPWSNKKFSALPRKLQESILDYDIIVEELSGYSDEEIKDVFVRMNKYVVKLSPQELRHAKESGAFYDFVEDLGKWDFWTEHKVFTPLQVRRMRAVEFSAELAILLIEGAQDKKSAVDLYYGRYQKSFSAGAPVKKKLQRYLSWISQSISEFNKTRFRKPVDLYALIGALERLSSKESLTRLDQEAVGSALKKFDAETRRKKPTGQASQYLAAASRQTDNIGPRNTRIRILLEVIRNA